MITGEIRSVRFSSASAASLAPALDVTDGVATEVFLRPPDPAAVKGKLGSYNVFVSFGSNTAMVVVEDRPAQHARLRSLGVTFAGPDVAISLKTEEPVEFLILAVPTSRVRTLAAASVDLTSSAGLVTIDYQDAGIAALSQELRRSLLGDDLRHPAYRQALADALVVRLLCHFLGDLGEHAPSETLPTGRLGKVLRYIDANLDNVLRVSALAEMADLTRSHFSRAFQQATGEPPQRYILKRRVCRARDLLSGSELGVADVAVRSGFSSQAHLSTAFRNEVGTTPGRYRTSFRRDEAG